VKNTGDGAGEEVVQMYVKHLKSSVERPIKELKGFKRISLQPGPTKTLTMLQGTQLAYWNSIRHSSVVGNGKIQIMGGSSSADTHLNKSIDVIQ